MNLNNSKIPFAALISGNSTYLVKLEEKFVYKDGQKTDETYHKATVVVPSNHYEQYEVSVFSLNGLPCKDDETIAKLCADMNPLQVEFINAYCTFYTDFKTHETKISIKAAGIRAVTKS